MKAQPRSFSQFIGRNIMLAFSLIVTISFLRNFVPFPVSYVALIALACVPFAYLLKMIQVSVEKPPRALLVKFLYEPSLRFSFPKPNKSDIMPFVPVLMVGLVEFLYFQAYPIFPQFASADFIQHVNVARQYANGWMPGLSSQALYFGVEYLLSLGLLLGGMPLAITRYEMGILVALSPLMIYDFCLTLFKSHKKAWAASMFYAFTGSWFAMVFVSGLYANFYGILASLFLAAMSVDFLTKKVGVSTLFLLFMAILNAFLSHYSTLFMVLLLTFYVLACSKKEKVFRRGLLLSTLLLAPIGVGAVAFRSLIGTLLGFLGGSFNFQSGTWLSQRIPLPVLSYLVAEVNDDYLAVLMIGVLSAFVVITIKKPSLEKALLLAWFFLPMCVVPFAPIGWRFAFIALFSLVIVSGLMIGGAWDFRFKKSDHPLFYYFAKQLTVLGILLLVLSMSWTSKTVAESGSQGYALADAQRADMQAMRWMQENSSVYDTFLSVSDFQFTYANQLVHRNVVFNLTAFAAPEIASGMASQMNASYIIATNLIVGAQPFSCSYPFAMSLSSNASEVKVGGKVSMRLAVAVFDPHNKKIENGSAAIWGNGQQLGVVTIYKGVANFTAVLPESGNYSFWATIATESTNPLILLSTSHPRPHWIQSSPSQTSTSCFPWTTFTWQRLGCHTPKCLVYSDQFVKIWKVRGT